MSKRYARESWFDALGGLEDYRSNASSVGPNAFKDGHRVNSSKSMRNRSKIAIPADPSKQRRGVRSASSNRAGSSAAVTDMKALTISSSTRKRIESEEEVRARIISRARAYESLCEAEGQVSGQPPTPPSKESSPSPLHPTSMHPGWTPHGPAPLKIVHENIKTIVPDSQTSEFSWKPQKPVYAQGAPGREAENRGSKETANRVSQYVPYRPPPPVPPKDKPHQLKPKPGSRSGVKRRPLPLDLHGAATQNSSNGEASRTIMSSARPRTANSSPRSGVQPWDISKPYEVNQTRNSRANDPPNAGKRVYKAYTPSATPSPSTSTFPSQVRRLLTPPQSPSPSPSPRTPLSPSYSTTSIPPSPLPSPSRSSISRSRSPARGSWTADRPRQKRFSFVDRARDRMRASWHLNLQKAGARPLSSFEVRDVRKAYVKDVAAEWTECPLMTTTETETATTVVVEGFEDFGGLVGRARRHQLRESWREKRRGEGEGEVVVDEVVGIEKEEEIERARGLSFDAHAAGLSRADSLFLGARDRPASETFFASDWSQQQVIDQAKEMVASLPASSSFHRGPFGKKDGDEAAAPKRRTAAASSASARRRAASADDRGHLPSQARGRSRIPVPTRPKLSRRQALPAKGSKRLS